MTVLIVPPYTYLAKGRYWYFRYNGLQARIEAEPGSAKFGIVPEMTDALRMQFLPIWAAYRMGREEAHNAD